MKKYILKLVAVLCLQITGCAAIPSDFTNSVISVVLNQTPTIPKFAYVAVTNSNYTIQTNDFGVLFTQISGARFAYLPKASTVPPGWQINVFYDSGAANSVLMFPYSGDTVGGLGGYQLSDAQIINRTFTSDGISNWQVDKSLASQTYVANNYAPIVSPTFTGTVTLGTNGLTFLDGSTQPSAGIPSFGMTPFIGGNSQWGWGDTYACSGTPAAVVSRSVYTNFNQLNGIRIALPTYYNAGSHTYTSRIQQITGMTNNVDVMATLEYPLGNTTATTTTPFTFSGRQVGRLFSPGLLYSDILNVSIPPGKTYAVRLLESRLASTTNYTSNGETGNLVVDGAVVPGSRPGGFSGNWGTGEGVFTLSSAVAGTGSNVFTWAATYLTGATSFTSVTNANNTQWLKPITIGYGPSWGLTNCIIVIGDSIVAYGGADRWGMSPLGNGFLGRTFNPYYHYATLGNNTETIEEWTGSSALLATTAPRRSMFGLASHAIVEMGRNDCGFQTNTATTQANLIAMWQQLKTFGCAVTQTTYPPQTTSTDGFRTTANQTTVISYQTNRLVMNQWFRAGAPITITNGVITAATNGQAGAIYASLNIATNSQAGHPCALIIDICPAIETATDSGIWKASLGDLASGTVTAVSGQSITDSTGSFPTTPSTGGYLGYWFWDSTTSQSSVIVGNQATAIQTALTLTVNIGDSYKVYRPFTGDGVHPTGEACGVIATYITGLLGTNSVGRPNLP
jgi:lysophospholipase L1-like esterase